MPLLMTEMAKGSDAMRTMQQNVMGSENDQLAEDARKADLQAKIQEDKLQVQQKEQDVNRTRLANIVTQSNIDLNDRVQTAVAALQKDPAYQKASESEQATILAKKLEGAGAVEEAAKVRDHAAAAELKEAQTKIKTQEAADAELAKGFSMIADASDEQVKGIIGKWDDKQKAVIASQLGPDWEENAKKDPTLFKKQMGRLMLNAKGQNQAMMMTAKEQIQKMVDATKVEIELDREKARIRDKVNGEDKKEDRAAKKAFQTTTNQVANDERISDRDINKQKALVEEAKQKYMKATRWYGGELKGEGKEFDAWNAAATDLQNLQREQAQRAYDRYAALDPSPEVNAQLARYTKLLTQLGEPIEDPKNKKPEEKKDTSNTPKPAPKDNKPQFEEGKVYKDAKGNKAKYVNGKWVPQ